MIQRTRLQWPLVVIAFVLCLPLSPVAASHGDLEDGDLPNDGQTKHGPPEHAAVGTKRADEVAIGDGGAIKAHMDQARIEAGDFSLGEVIAQGEMLFSARVNKFDGQGRPLMTSAGKLRKPPGFNNLRASGPDASACTGCHLLPRAGGGGDFAWNLFGGLGGKDPVEFSTHPSLSNERTGPSIFGDGALEMLGREMTVELRAARDAALAQAKASGQPVSASLSAKAVSFGSLVAMPDGRIDPLGIEGVDWDLLIKPLGHKGILNLRGVAVGGAMLHLGMQAQERFGFGTDPDGDGVTDELTVGDMTALSIFMASLPIPGRVLPRHPAKRAAVDRGERLFSEIRCASCHVPEMILDDPFFSEPNPFAGPVRFAGKDLIGKPFRFDLTRDGPRPRLERTEDGRGIVRAFTDFKRHDITDAELTHFANEKIPGGPLRGTAPASAFTVAAPPLFAKVFLTEKLWDVGSTSPFGHRSDLTTLTEVIHFHGGEARASRNAFFSLQKGDQGAVIEFLKSLQIVPETGARVVLED